MTVINIGESISQDIDALPGLVTQGDVCYLLHFYEPHPGSQKRKVQHYIGRSSDLIKRLGAHREGTGSAFCRSMIRDNGIGFVLVRTWQGKWDEEIKLKGRKNAKNLCPLCNGK